MVSHLRSLLRLLAAPVLTLTLLVSDAAGANPSVDGIRLGVQANATRVVLDLAGALEYSIFTLADPYRVVVDLPEVEWRLSGSSIPAGGGLVQRLRFGLFQPGKSRLVLDVDRPVVVTKAFMLQPTADFGYRLVLDLAPVTVEEFQRQARLAPPRPAPPPPAAPPVVSDKPLIVIDPGHGGVDPGAITSGIHEKHITLAVGLELKRQLEATGRYRVALTRNRDIFVRLSRRVEIARDLRAGLFISMHADAIANRRVRGATVYTLSEKASDTVAAELAANHNKADIIAGVDFSTEAYDDDVATILIDLAQRETLNYSAEFANLVIPELGKEARLLRKTHRFAGFRVLKAPDVPSVLIEMGYLSNLSEAKLLRKRTYQRKLAAAIVRAVKRYFERQQEVSRQ
ncbi:MAG: N-acetylmuramoyl-L-alanine amidase [Proteobacteria bacterium]|nr:N-acetylmuramoyl-L-alanine amidase [Pseudomonadota bacterium]